jgi:type II secretory pathway component PulF
MVLSGHECQVRRANELMSLTLTPGQLATRAAFYHQLAQLTAAGLGVTAGLEQLQRSPPALSYRAPIRQALADLAAGCTFTESLQRAGSWLPAFDLALLQAGEQSGRLDACLRLLADYYAERARLARQLIADLAYPVFLFHFAILLFGFIRWLSGTGLDAARATLSVLLPTYALVGLIVYAVQNRHGEAWRAWVERVVAAVPVLGTAQRYLAVARLAAALEALLNAGVTIVEAWDMAATASGSPTLRRSVTTWRPLLNAGQTPAELLRSASAFPGMFVQQYATGEISGKLDETLRRMHRYYQDEGSRKLHIVSQWAPRFIYLCVMLMIAYRIVQFYAAYFRNVSNAAGF